MEKAWDVEVADCSMGCCWYCWDMCTGGGDGNDNEVFLYENKWSSLSKLMTSYQLEEWNNITPKRGISKLNRPLRGYHCFSV